jgi:hypothetical protein
MIIPKGKDPEKQNPLLLLIRFLENNGEEAV